MFCQYVPYTVICVLIVNLLALTGDTVLSWSSPVLPALTSKNETINPLRKSINKTEVSLLTSLVHIGALIGPFPFGYIAMKWGRKPALLVISIPLIISYLVLGFSASLPWYYVARVLGGLGEGATYAILPVYIAEIANDANRGTLSMSIDIFWATADLLPYVIGPFLPFLEYNLFLACIPITFFVLFLLIAPESPYFLLKNNKHEAAEAIVLKLRNNTNESKAQLAEMYLLMQNEKEEESVAKIVKSKTFFKCLLIVLFLISSTKLSGNIVILAFSEEIFIKADVKTISPEICSIILGVLAFVSSIVATILAQYVKRRFLLLVSCFGVSVTNAFAGFFFYFKNSKFINIEPIWLVVAFGLFFVFFETGLTTVPWAISSEIFPTKIKPFTGALASSLSWSISFFLVRYYISLNDFWGEHGTFWFFAVYICIVFFYVLFFLPETNGKTFREIQDLLKH